MNTSLLVLFAVAISFIQITNGQPGKDMEHGNLKHTFRSQEEIPSAFFDNPTQTRNEQRKIYPPCQDGSGGICIEEGQCPPELKPERNNTFTNACGPGLECCFGPAMNDKSCSSRGGECMTPTVCGNQPIFKEAVDCNTQKGEICCILI